MSNPDSSQLVIDVSGLSKSFNGIKAVIDLTLQIQAGTIFGFLGANGSGKTTCLRLLSGLLVPDQGKGRCLGLDLFTQTKMIQAQIGYMPQQFCLYQNLTVYENLDFIARIYGLRNRKARLDEVIELLHLVEKKNQISCTLSGGWKQRVALAAALLHCPRILLLDEPTSGIDPQSRVLIWNHIQDLVGQGVTVLLSTHLMDEAERCHQLAYMSYGELLANGSSVDIIQSSRLYSWRIKGKNLADLKLVLTKNSVPLQLIEKGSEIRISSLHPDILKQFDPSVFLNYEVEATDTTLEDAFIFKIQHEET
ncbi:ABC transporter ATP-binding protein [Legionella bononiensis]|uniref:ABC transporter ATP-binding protein n=1 Tax=Legionella bononiensis TaxID=2793102 RepID=A0ABS1W7M1_9GAMM|nr:ABC transporter ATP-binding protein [Legionella bononiensis]MBL7480117.1 ABC transporter ATP-binding protein [Legionella bononiensis]MBL7525368.1 ABC transporter ATP-binding protein [Legionella bononiensis]MBL7561552.1 ABC transporter ATP-binding protein [Legionella bononiensis]